MLRLFIDTSSEYLSVVLTDDCVITAVHRAKVGRRMSEVLHKVIDDFLNTSGVNVTAIDEFYAIVGPGSFTGVRIGVSMVMGLAEGAGKPCYGLSSLDIAALSNKFSSEFDVISSLKGEIYALKHYNFANNNHSEYQTIELSSTDGYIQVNTGLGTYAKLEDAVQDERFLAFRCECTPLYLRKSEVEIIADSKG